MKSDATIGDVIHLLDDPEEFVRGIVGSFISGGFDKDAAVIRIGTSGAGKAPNYCIEQGSMFSSFTVESTKLEMKHYGLRAVFHGRGHKVILEDDFKGLSWGSPMSFDEVQGLLGRLRSGRKVH